MRQLIIFFRASSAIWQLTFIAIAVRLLAAVFSEGYFAHDDHFLVVEAAQSWADGYDYNNWLPWNQGAEAIPSGHSFFYVGLHFLLFELLNFLGLDDPKGRMLIVRLLHALWSLVVVRAGYRIALRLSNATTAWSAGLFLALFCFMPFLSVRQLVEVACIPFLMLGGSKLLDLTSDRSRTAQLLIAFVAGIWLGFAINVRFQTLFFAAGPGLVLLLMNWRAAIAYGAGVLLPVLLVQGSIDMLLWGRPFAELTEYVRYNFEHATDYFDQPWYNYLILLAAIFIPPLSLAVFFGFFTSWRKHLPIWMAVFLFLAIHSYFPNKQERFILPIVPLFFVLGWCAWEQWRARSAFWTKRPAVWRGILRWTWAINIPLLIGLSLSSGKRSRVEAMSMLREIQDVRGIVIEDSHEHEPPQAPLFYLGKWDATLLYVPDTLSDFRATLTKFGPAVRPNVVFFIGDEDLAYRVAWMERQTGELDLVGTAMPGLLDRTVHWLNPVNRNEAIAIYRLVDAGH